MFPPFHSVLTPDTILHFNDFASTSLSNMSSSETLTAIHWDVEKGAWQVIAESISIAGDKTITVSINRMGQYSLVIPDKAPTTPPIPVSGQSLEGAALVAYPEGISGEGIVVPAVIMVGENTQARANAKLTLRTANFSDREARIVAAVRAFKATPVPEGEEKRKDAAGLLVKYGTKQVFAIESLPDRTSVRTASRRRESRLSGPVGRTRLTEGTPAYERR